MSKQRKNHLTIYLIRKEFDRFDDVVDRERSNISYRSLSPYGKLYYRISEGRAPRWVEGFFEGALDAREWVTSTISAALILPVQIDPDTTRLFALTFGYGWTLLSPETIERRFGLKCVLNTVRPDSLRQIRKTLVSGNARKSSEQMPRKSTVSEFSLDYEQDLLESITAVGEKGAPLEGQLTGSDALSISAAVSLGGISDFLVDNFNLYQLDTYKESFSWIDHISSVKDERLINRLEATAIESINSRNQMVWFAIPVVVDWDKVAGFSYTRKGKVFDDVLVQDVLNSLSGDLTDINQLKRKRVYAIGAQDEDVIDSWPLSRCLYGELQIDGGQYCVTDGNWYRVDSDYSEVIRRDYESTAVADLKFPDYEAGCGGEGAYNEKLAKVSDDYLLMDKRLIVFGGGQSKFELCDVLSSDGKLIHIKRYGGSSVMSHLFNQGLVSMDLIKSEPRFLDKVNEIIKKEDPTGRFFVDQKMAKEVVFGIVTTDDRALPNIPFFSKIAFHHVKRRLKSMGVKVSIGAIHEGR